MPNYAFTYYGEPNIDQPEQGAKHMEKWRAWMGGLGDAMINPGVPFGPAKIVSSTGVSDDAASKSNRVTGFSVVTAASMDAALAMAQACPHLEHGTIGVAEAMEMS